MKVHYKKSITQLIDIEIAKAAKDNKRVDYIELNYSEWKELIAIAEREAWFRVNQDNYGNKINPDIHEIFYNDVKLIQETRMV